MLCLYIIVISVWVAKPWLMHIKNYFLFSIFYDYSSSFFYARQVCSEGKKHIKIAILYISDYNSYICVAKIALFYLQKRLVSQKRVYNHCNGCDCMCAV
jgi:hypothetical protein